MKFIFLMPIWHYQTPVLMPIWHYQQPVNPFDGAKMALKTPVLGKNDSANLAHIYNILPYVSFKKHASDLEADDWKEVQRMYYKTCPRCGSHLDPGERCDCQDQRQRSDPRPADRSQMIHKTVFQDGRHSTPGSYGRMNTR